MKEVRTLKGVGSLSEIRTMKEIKPMKDVKATREALAKRYVHLRVNIGRCDTCAVRELRQNDLGINGSIENYWKQ